MPQHHPDTPKPNPTGTQLVRLKDIPDPIRQRAALKLMSEAKDAAEHVRLFELGWNPGNAGGRIAA